MAPQIIRVAVTALVVLGFAGSAPAALLADLTLNDCDSMGCEGSTLYLKVEDGESLGYSSGSFVVTYTIDTEFYTGGGTNAGFNQIGFKAISHWDSGEVIGYPDGSMAINEVGYGPGPWEPVFEAPINSNSLCSNINGNSSKVCVAGFVDIRDPLPDGTYDYTWIFLIEGGTLLDVEDWHLGAQYANGPYRSQGQIISAQVPEPTAAVLFGLGAILVARRARRR